MLHHEKKVPASGCNQCAKAQSNLAVAETGTELFLVAQTKDSGFAQDYNCCLVFGLFHWLLIGCSGCNPWTLPACHAGNVGGLAIVRRHGCNLATVNVPIVWRCGFCFRVELNKPLPVSAGDCAPVFQRQRLRYAAVW